MPTKVNPTQSLFKGPSCSNELLDTIIRTLMDPRNIRADTTPLSSRELKILFTNAAEVLMKDHVCLKLDLQKPMYVVGDIFGQYGDIVRLFNALGDPSEDNRYLFLGNYVDRGTRSIETLALLLAFKSRYPQNIFLIRGNHECRYVSCHYGFLDECLHRYSVKIWKLAINVFASLPALAIIEGAIFCTHSGLVPPGLCTKLTSQSQLRETIAYCVKRPQRLSNSQLLIDLAWSEPCLNMRGWQPHPVGMGQLYGEDQVERFCEKFQFSLVVRSNETLNYGYEVMANSKLITLFSAVNQANSMRNYGAVLYLQRSQKCKLVLARVKLLKPVSLLQGRSAARMAFTIEDSSTLGDAGGGGNENGSDASSSVFRSSTPVRHSMRSSAIHN